MPKVSAVPGSPQSSTSTVKGSVVVAVERITEAVPVNWACLPPGDGQELELLQAVSAINDAGLCLGWSLRHLAPDFTQHPFDCPHMIP